MLTQCKNTIPHLSRINFHLAPLVSLPAKTLIFALLLIPQAFAQNTLPSLIKDVQPSVVTITIYDKSGQEMGLASGFFVTERGQIVTNYHVIERAFAAEIKTAEGKIYAVTDVIAEDKENDLIRIAVDPGRDSAKPLPLSRNSPVVGERIVVIGSPLGLEQTVSEGIISSIRGSRRQIQITAPISPGSSGSPVVDMRGEVIGVATWQLSEGQNLNFAVSVEKISTMKLGGKKNLAVWTVQVNAYPEEERAKLLVYLLKTKGYDAYMQEVHNKGKIYYRVRVGKYGRRAEAERMLELLQNRENFNRIFVTER